MVGSRHLDINSSVKLLNMLLKTTSLAAALVASVVMAASVPAWEDWAHGWVQLKNDSIHFRYAGSGPPRLVQGNPQYSVSIGIFTGSSFKVLTALREYMAVRWSTILLLNPLNADYAFVVVVAGLDCSPSWPLPRALCSFLTRAQ